MVSTGNAYNLQDLLPSGHILKGTIRDHTSSRADTEDQQVTVFWLTGVSLDTRLL